MDIPKRLSRVFAELEFELWEAMVVNELSPDGDIKFNFTVTRDGQGSLPKMVEVIVSIRTLKDASD